MSVIPLIVENSWLIATLALFLWAIMTWMSIYTLRSSVLRRLRAKLDRAPLHIGSSNLVDVVRFDICSVDDKLRATLSALEMSALLKQGGGESATEVAALRQEFLKLVQRSRDADFKNKYSIFIQNMPDSAIATTCFGSLTIYAASRELVNSVIYLHWPKLVTSAATAACVLFFMLFLAFSGTASYIWLQTSSLSGTGDGAVGLDEAHFVEAFNRELRTPLIQAQNSMRSSGTFDDLVNAVEEAAREVFMETSDQATAEIERQSRTFGATLAGVIYTILALGLLVSGHLYKRLVLDTCVAEMEAVFDDLNFSIKFDRDGAILGQVEQTSNL